MSSPTSHSVHTSRIVELLRYIAALQPQETHADHISQKDRLLDASHVHNLPGVSFPAQTDPAAAWVRVSRVQPTSPPALPEALVPWVVVEDNPTKDPIEPKIRKRIDNPNAHVPKGSKKNKKVVDTPSDTAPESSSGVSPEAGDEAADTSGAYLFLRNLPDIEAQIQTWMSQWEQWAASERPIRQSAAIYQRLYQLFRDVAADGQSDTRDVVCGLGHAQWVIRDKENSSSIPYSYPLILQRCDVRMSEGNDYPLEIWPLATAPTLHLGRLGDGVHGEAAESFWQSKMAVKNDDPINPFVLETFAPLVSGIIARLDATGSFHDVVPEQLPSPTERLTAFPWFTFFQKKRSHNHLLSDLRRLEHAVEAAPQLPEILVNLVDRDSVMRLPEQLPAFRGLEQFTASKTNASAQDLYFPLPYNEEQIQVVQRLEASPGVVVQGPPGTGKSHTIANIVSHYLANGQRVLVTSHSAAALSAVREKIPESICDLTVALLTSETESLADFEKSVREIADRLATFNPNISQRTADDLVHTVNGLYKQLEQVDAQILDHMKIHHVTHSLQGQTVSLMDLARFHSQQPVSPSWLGRVPSAQLLPSTKGDRSQKGLMFPTIPASVDDTIIQSLRQARLDAGVMFPLLFEPISDPNQWPRDKEVRSAIQAQQRLTKLQKQLDEGLTKSKTKPFDDGAIWALTQDVSTLGEHIASLQHHQSQADTLDALTRRPASIQEPLLWSEPQDAPADHPGLAASKFCQQVIGLRDQLRQQLGLVFVPSDAVFNTEFRQAVARGASGGSPVGGFFQRMTVNKSLKTWIDAIKVEGRAPATSSQWQHVSDHLQALDLAQQIPASWNRYAMAFGWSDLSVSPSDPAATATDGAIDPHKALVVGTPSAQDLFRQVEHVAQMAQFQLTRSNWRRLTAPAIEHALGAMFVDPTLSDAQTATKSKWTRKNSDTTPSIHLRAKPVVETEQEAPKTLSAPWGQWDQKSDVDREAVLSVAERSLNLWQAIEEEQRYVDMFKKNIQQLLDKSKVHAVLPELAPLPIPPKTRQTAAAPTLTFMDKVRQFLETDMWASASADTTRRAYSSRFADTAAPSDPTEARLSQWRVLLTSAERVYGAIKIASKPAEHALHTLAQAGFGDWVHALLKNPLDNLPNPKRVNAALPDDALVPDNWRDLVQQSQIQAFISSLDEQHALMGHFNQRRHLVQSLSIQLSELAAEKSWSRLATNVTPQQRQALGSYLSAVRAVGSGTGKRSARHQQDARQAMSEAFSAVPCWIMPTSKVSEVMPSELGLFDLVIVDEASQSDLAALPALIRGKKILIVGDDKQVSPSNFVQEDVIVQQRRTLLANQPFAPLMAPDRSIYDLFSGVLPNSSIMLREHFRCVEPIIAWSNKNYYHNKMVPLRLPSQAERLDPPLIDILVEDGKMEDDLNHAEAAVIAREIQAIVQDPEMKGKTIGVVTLPSKDAQSNHIRDAIDQAISQGAYLNHKILVGPPARFQGSERDIMFVAMTWDGQSGGASDRPEFHQRFNVAMSRARDRMILVRSIPDTALRSGTLLSKVVNHFHDDHVQQRHSGLHQCKSELERDVFQALSARGYDVQAHIGPKHAEIDLVVEDQSGRRLAIECDGDLPTARLQGDTWQDAWNATITRQRILERAGWTFLRLTAASWYLQPETTLNKILSTLRDLGITPNAHQEHDVAPLVSRKIVRAFEPVQAPQPQADVISNKAQDLPDNVVSIRDMQDPRPAQAKGSRFARHTRSDK